MKINMRQYFVSSICTKINNIKVNQAVEKLIECKLSCHFWIYLIYLTGSILKLKLHTSFRSTQVHKEEFTKIFTALYKSHKLGKPSITPMNEQPNKLRYIFSRNRTEEKNKVGLSDIAKLCQ